MKKEDLENIINEAFEKKQTISEKSDKKILDAISETIELTDKGSLRVDEKKNGKLSEDLDSVSPNDSYSPDFSPHYNIYWYICDAMLDDDRHGWKKIFIYVV